MKYILKKGETELEIDDTIPFHMQSDEFTTLVYANRFDGIDYTISSQFDNAKVFIYPSGKIIIYTYGTETI